MEKYTLQYTAEEIDKLLGEVEVKEVTYAELREIGADNELVTGQWYRITDYECTTTQPNTQSAGHVFDILVQAVSSNRLSEDALATRHAGDTYFANSKLEAWKLKYCFDNQSMRFAWADSANGKGVIYYMKDEWGNEAPYDFKNIQFKRWKATWVGEGTSSLNNTYCLSMLYDNETAAFNREVLDIADINAFQWKYTFHCTYSVSGKEYAKDATMVIDASDNNLCHGNIIREAHGDPQRDALRSVIYLNDIVFLNYYSVGGGDNVCAGNVFDFGCYNMTFGASCFGNKFGFDSSCNVFGHYFKGNTFGLACSYNTFDSDCNTNIMGVGCNYNVFAQSCRMNSFGADCSGNTIGSGFAYNTFGANCQHNTIGHSGKRNTFGATCSNNTIGYNFMDNILENDCGYNTFGNGCALNKLSVGCGGNTFSGGAEYNTLGIGCNDNTFGATFYHNSLGNWCSGNTFGDNCSSISLGNSCNGNTFGNEFRDSTLHDGCGSNTFGNDVSAIVLGASCLYNIFGNYMKNITIDSGMTYCDVTGGENYNAYVQNAHILSGVKGTNNNNKTTVTFEANLNAAHAAGMNSSGVLKIWAPADLIQ